MLVPPIKISQYYDCSPGSRFATFHRRIICSELQPGAI